MAFGQAFAQSGIERANTNIARLRLTIATCLVQRLLRVLHLKLGISVEKRCPSLDHPWIRAGSPVHYCPIVMPARALTDHR